MEPGRSAWRSYAHITDVLRDRISTGRYAAGTLLPSEAKLSVEFGVVRNTVRRALAVLTEEGVIETVPGRGRRVRPPTGTPAVPLYRRIAADLSATIQAGELPPGHLLPSEADLAARYGVSRGTARQALLTLDAAGLIETRQGCRRRVRPV